MASSTAIPVLERLAEARGILPRYHDVHGVVREASHEALRLVLESMGLATSTEADLRAELERCEGAPWRRVLPPVVVAWAREGPVRIRLAVPENRLGSRLSATLDLEDGRRIARDVVPGELPEFARRDVDGVVITQRELALDAPVPPGYHRFRIEGFGSGPAATTTLIVTPGRAQAPGARAWGPVVQLYSLRSTRNWGVGDLGDLATLAAAAAAEGAAFVGVSPLHALFPTRPEYASPYGPTSRELLNPLALGPAAVPDFAECEAARVVARELEPRLQALRESPLVQWTAVAAARRPLLGELWRHFRERHLAVHSPRARAFREFVAARRELLEAYGVFEALTERFGQLRDWPAEYRDPGSPAVLRFAEDRRDRVGFHQYLQWECDRQLAAAGRPAGDGRASGSSGSSELPLGLYLDLAVGVDATGFDVWRRPDLFARNATLGAPPDAFNPLGQEWGLAPWVPDRLREAAYTPFIDCLRVAMAHAGILRVDHVMGLMRGYWVPRGVSPAEGVYVRYPFHDLLGVLTLESHRHGCVVVGEDLGTVPDEVREALGPGGVHSCRLLWFTRGDDGRFLPPVDYPAQSLVAATTHDLPTVRGFWEGRDLDLRAALGIDTDPEATRRAHDERRRSRELLLEALRAANLLTGEIGPDDPYTPALALAVHRFLARAPAALLAVQLEDVLGQAEQANFPGTVDEHPNWRRRLYLDVDQIVDDPAWVELTAALSAERSGAASS